MARLATSSLHGQVFNIATPINRVQTSSDYLEQIDVWIGLCH